MRIRKMTSIILLVVLSSVIFTGCEGISEQNAIDEMSDDHMDLDTGVEIELGDEELESNLLNEQSTVGEIIHEAVFLEYGRLLFPVDLNISEDMTLNSISNSATFIWYSNVQSDKTVEIVNHLKQEVIDNNRIFYEIYSQEEITANPTLEDTGLFFFRGEPGEEFAITNAGGGFRYVGAMHDSFPQALELSKKGYNAFSLIYRTEAPYEDLARAIEFIHANQEVLQVSTANYSLWGGSAGARMAIRLGNSDYLSQLTQRSDIEPAAAVIAQYTGYSNTSQSDAPTYSCVGSRDGIVDWNVMKTRLEQLEYLGIPTEFHVYDGLKHGFGIGTDTVAEGWIDDAIEFWENQMD